MFEELHFWIFEPFSSVFCLIVVPEVICALKSQIERHLSVRDMERTLGMLQAGATKRYAAA